MADILPVLNDARMLRHFMATRYNQHRRTGYFRYTRLVSLATLPCTASITSWYVTVQVIKRVSSFLRGRQSQLCSDMLRNLAAEVSAEVDP
jgi:hypothetical protein